MSRYVIAYHELAGQLLALPRNPAIVAIDGPGGAGKSTFAARLVAAIDTETTLLHTDEFATPSEPTAWWPRLHAVIERLAQGHPTTYEPFDWTTRCLLPAQTVEPTKLVVIEGVSASRREWAEHLSYRIWIDANADVCRERGTQRDGIGAADWDAAAAAEASFFTRDGAFGRADLVVDASANVSSDPDICFAHR